LNQPFAGSQSLLERPSLVHELFNESESREWADDPPEGNDVI